MKIKNFTKIFLFVAVAALFSCSGSDDGAGGDGGGATGSSLTVSVNSATIFVGESVTFTVVNNLGANLTSTSDFKIGGTAISNPHTFDAAGSFTVAVTNGTLSGSTTIIVQEIPVPSAITLTVDKDAFWYDIDSATFTVMDDLGNDVTGLVAFSSDSGTLTNPASFDAPGMYNATATFTLEDNSTLTSNTLVFTAVESTHTTKVMIEDYTGTWCQYCPRLAYAV